MNDLSGKNADRDLESLLGAAAVRPWRRPGFWMIVVLTGVALYAGVLWWNGGDAQVSYRTVEAGRGDITVLVTATGTLQPLNQVEVGSELSGTIQRVLVDYNDEVARGQVIAELDTTRLAAQVVQARASLASAEARREEANATVTETGARFRRCETLAARQLCSQEELDTLRAAHTRAQAGARSAEAEVSVARATLDAIETDLAKAQIRSPVDGVVLKREVEAGQTVAASLQTPVLFVLAEDLSKMRLHVFVDEADIGQVREGQAATFTVDAWPGRGFPATLTQVRVAPQETEGVSVVSYEAVLEVGNEGRLLLPGMTATADIVVQEVTDALVVPNAVLRFSPPQQDDGAAAQSGNVLTRLFIRSSRQRAPQRTVSDLPGGEREIWALEQGAPVLYTVRTGATDGRVTEILDGAIAPGAALITGIVTSP